MAIGVLLIVVIALGAAFAVFFARLPIERTTLGIDWQGLWAEIRSGIHYEGWLRHPPWSVFFLYPLARLPMLASWGITVYLSLIVLVLSVPRFTPQWRTWLGIMLLTTSYPALRVFADGNLEAVMIAGLLLVYYGYRSAKPTVLAAGVLLSTAKPQEVFLLLPVLALYMMLTLPRRSVIQTGIICLAFMIPALLLRGEEWWRMGIVGPASQLLPVDTSLAATLDRLGWQAPAARIVLSAAVGAGALYVGWRSRPNLSRELMGMLVAASLLAAPYARPVSVLTILAIGVIPILQRDLRVGLALFLLYSLPLGLNRADYQGILVYYHTGLTLLSMLVLGAYAWRSAAVEMRLTGQASAA